MTLVVASLVDADADAMLARARASAADVVELRLDRIAGADAATVKRLASEVGRPALATARTVADGGALPADPAPRRALLLAAVEAGIPYVDVEATAPFADEILAAAKARGVRVVLSLHLPDTPRSGAVVAFLREAAERGAWCGKLATATRDAGALARLAEAGWAARRERLPFALMAVDDAWLRRLAPALGAALVYGSDGPPAAPGQVPAAELKAAAALTPRPGRAVALLGHPVAHSRSPPMQNAAFRACGVDATYVALDVAPDRVPAAMELLRTAPFLGANVTLPHKETVLRLADERAPSAVAAGAANVLVNDGGTLVAHNTDGDGALRALREAGFEIAEAEALVFGAGGAARAVVRALRDAGADVAVTNRSPERAAALAKDLDVPALTAPEATHLLDAFDLVVNATTVGLHDHALPFDVQRLHPDAVVLDCVYRPGGTALARAAAARGLGVVAGEAMLLHQGAAAFELWTGKAAPLDAMRAALGAAMEVAP